MKNYILFGFLVLSISGCDEALQARPTIASYSSETVPPYARRITTPNGKPGVVIECAHEPDCWVKAGEICVGGYIILDDKSVRQDKVADGFQGIHPAKNGVLLVECKDYVKVVEQQIEVKIHVNETIVNDCDPPYSYQIYTDKTGKTYNITKFKPFCM